MRDGNQVVAPPVSHLQKMFKRYALGCNYHYVANKKAFLKEYGNAYGYFNAKHNQAVVTKLKSQLNKPILSLLFASEFNNFLYVTDQHGDATQVESVDGQMLPLLWICLVQNGRVIDSGSVYTSPITGEDEIYSGDMFISRDKLPFFVAHVARQNTMQQQATLTTSIHCSDDIQSLFDQSAFYIQPFDLNQFLIAPKVEQLAKKYMIKPVKANSFAAKLLLAILTVGLVWYGVDKYLAYKAEAVAIHDSQIRQQQKEQYDKQLRIEKSKTFIGLVNQNNASYVLSSLIDRWATLNYLVAGWDLTDIDYVQQRVGILRLTYQRNGYATLDGFLKESASIQPIKLDIEKDASKVHVDVAIMSTRNEPDLTLQAFNNEQNRILSATQLMSAIQSYSLAYVASQATIVDGRRIQTIQVNGLGDYTLLALTKSAESNPFFIISDLKLSIHDSMITNWSFKGVIYE